MKGNLENYKAFYYVAVYGSFTQAAGAMCLSQPAVSQSVKLLEQELQVSLFVRTSKGVRLTVEGEMIFVQIKAAFEHIEKGEQQLRQMLGLDLGEIRIGASDMTLQFYLLPFLEKFHEQYPDIKVIVTNGPTPETMENLERGSIDFGVISTPFSAAPHMLSKKVRRIQDIFVAGEKFKHLSGKRISYQALEQLPLICLEQNTSTRKYIDSFLSEKGVALSPEFELATSDIIVQFVRRNMGIGSVVEDFAMEYINSQEIFVLSFQEKIPNRFISIVRNDKYPLSVAAKSLWNLLCEEKTNIL